MLLMRKMRLTQEKDLLKVIKQVKSRAEARL